MIRGIEAVGSDIVDCAVRLHEELGPGLLESAYSAFLAHELGVRGHFVEREKAVSRLITALRSDVRCGWTSWSTSAWWSN